MEFCNSKFTAFCRKITIFKVLRNFVRNSAKDVLYLNSYTNFKHGHVFYDNRVQ